MEQQKDPQQKQPLGVEEMKELMDHVMDKGFKNSMRMFLVVFPVTLLAMMVMIFFMLKILR